MFINAEALVTLKIVNILMSNMNVQVKWTDTILLNLFIHICKNVDNEDALMHRHEQMPHIPTQLIQVS